MTGYLRLLVLNLFSWHQLLAPGMWCIGCGMAYHHPTLERILCWFDVVL